MSSETGAYYNRESYAGIWRRIFVDVIDSSFMLGVSLGILIILSGLFPDDIGLIPVVFFSCLILWIGYFVLLKGSKYGTLGYIIGGVKVVNLQGQKPSISSLFVRFMFAAFGPFNMLLDLFWIPGDTHRQALRDKFAQTYVVKRTAQIEGKGKMTHNYYDILGWSLFFSEVEVPGKKNI